MKKELNGTPIVVDDGHSFTMICCGCKLAHFVHVKTKKQGKVVLTIFIDEHETKVARKK